MDRDKLLTLGLLVLAFVGPMARANRVLLLHDKTQDELKAQFEAGINEGSSGQVNVTSLMVIKENSTVSFEEFCSILEAEQFTLVVDMLFGNWIKGTRETGKLGIPYVKVFSDHSLFLQASEELMRSQKSVDAALVFEDQPALEQGMQYVIKHSKLKVIAATRNDFKRLENIRPRPSNYILFGATPDLEVVYEEALDLKMVKRDTIWTLVMQDLFEHFDLNVNLLQDQTLILQLDTVFNCCTMNRGSITYPCDCKGISFPMYNVYFSGLALGDAIVSQEGLVDQQWTCQADSDGVNTDILGWNGQTVSAKDISYEITQHKDNLAYTIMPKLEFEAFVIKNSKKTSLGKWMPDEPKKSQFTSQLEEIKRFYRVGVVLGKPWAWIEGVEDATNISLVDKTKPNLGLVGYCIDLLNELASEKRMNFDFEIIPNSLYGSNVNGTWTGIVGDLVSGEIDISVATLTMTTEREEVIDFVAPYFDQSGISIILRKKVPEQSIFKFMSVLKMEVWLGILGAVFIVALLLWGLDRFSPYSYYNNKDAYPEGARDFTFGESLWFSLTSLTPQGGGECPKALSGRVLVAAYWLFIVLMLATFTANLAAFLTVERMQTTVQNLEELARQSRINYTVMGGSPYLEYFQNMAGAEDELYKKWKELTLNSSSDQSRYRVWDYPVREQYTHVLKVIMENKPVATAEEGFRMVEANERGEFAFIHDASEIRYQFYENCNFTEIGEPFAEQPLAIAVQQGSHLQKEISKTILELQKERYFETLSGDYWKSNKRKNCPVLDDSQGITLRSLGGIFLATLCGLLLSMVALAVEMWKTKKNSRIENLENRSGKTVKVMSVGKRQIPVVS